MKTPLTMADWKKRGLMHLTLKPVIAIGFTGSTKPEQGFVTRDYERGFVSKGSFTSDISLRVLLALYCLYLFARVVWGNRLQCNCAHSTQIILSDIHHRQGLQTVWRWVRIVSYCGGRLSSSFIFTLRLIPCDMQTKIKIHRFAQQATVAILDHYW